MAQDNQSQTAQAHNDRGIAQARGGNLAGAVAAFEAALDRDPDFLLALNNLGNARVIMGRNEDALALFARALALQPGFAPALHNNGMALAALGRHEEAVDAFAKAIAREPDYVSAYNNLGYSLRALGRREEALAAFDNCLARDPNYGYAHAGRASLLQALGKIGEARIALERVVRLLPGDPTFHGALAEIKHFGPGDPQIAAMEALLAKMSSAPAAPRMELHFALGKAYDDVGRHRDAFAQWRQGNALKRAAITYNETAELGALRDIASVYTAPVIAALSGGGDNSDIPVFVIGMPRSGTSLVEQILASHPRVFGAGERAEFGQSVVGENPGGRGIYEIPQFSQQALQRIGARYAQELKALAPGAARIVDKLPENFFFAGLIHLALPRARIIHIARDPADTCLSCYSKSFARGLGYTYDLGELGRFYRAYQNLMAHWRAVLPAGAMLEVQYETLVGDLEGEARRIVDYCGLDWDARCAAFHQTERGVHTASQFQVRQPIYKSAIGRWRAYREDLGPLFEALAFTPS